jgi:hypothetical protein
MITKLDSIYFRLIIDGKGASTVFNGHTPLVDKLYTRSNHYISGNSDSVCRQLFFNNCLYITKINASDSIYISKPNK